MGLEKVIYLQDTMTQMQNDYLYKGNKKYLKFGKKLYGIDYDKWSNYFWELYIVKLFEEEIKEQLFEIDNIYEIAKKISNELKEERERIIIYSYIQGYIFGYKNLNLINKLNDICAKIFTEKNLKKIHISDIMRSSHMRYYSEFIKEELEEINNNEIIEDIVYTFSNKVVYQKLRDMDFKSNLIIIKSVVYDILLKDCIDKNKDGVWDGVIARVVKEFNKKYSIIF